MIFRAHLNLCDYLLCLFACCARCVLLADGVNESENEDVGGEYHEFDNEDPDGQ
jgi:hypothetical protein